VKTSLETLDEVKVKLAVEVEPQRVKQAFDRAARELARQVSLPGFRPGKAPRRLLEQRLGTGAIAQAAMEDAIGDYYLEALRPRTSTRSGSPRSTSSGSTRPRAARSPRPSRSGPRSSPPTTPASR
jgi:trigger factor